MTRSNVSVPLLTRNSFSTGRWQSCRGQETAAVSDRAFHVEPRTVAFFHLARVNGTSCPLAPGGTVGVTGGGDSGEPGLAAQATAWSRGLREHQGDPRRGA